jgi:hypothetical protein
MSDFLSEEVFSVPTLSKVAIGRLAEAFLAELSPATLNCPSELDLLKLVEYDLPERGIHVTPAERNELGNRLGATDAAVDPEDPSAIQILLLRELWDDLLVGGRRARRARATVAHELGHAILHVPLIRRWSASPARDLLLSRVERRAIKPCDDPEWQAWMMAGCLLAPHKTLNMIIGTSMEDACDLYNVSPAMMKAHLRRLGMLSGSEE